MKCTVSPDCSTFSCSADVEGESISLTLKIDGSKEPLTAEITLKVPSKEFDWSHSFKNGEKIQVPGFPLNIKGLVGADMYLVVYMYKGDGGVGFKVNNWRIYVQWFPVLLGQMTRITILNQMQDNNYSTSVFWI